MGVEPECKELVACMRNALQANPDLEVTILSDFLRGTRGIRKSEDSLTMLFPLLKEFPKNVKLLFFHTPLLSGLFLFFPFSFFFFFSFYRSPPTIPPLRSLEVNHS